jgi:hypothetical protein
VSAICGASAHDRGSGVRITIGYPRRRSVSSTFRAPDDRRRRVGSRDGGCKM